MLPLITTASGSAFQSFANLWLNVLRLTRLLHLVFSTLFEWPLVRTSMQGLNNFFPSILSMLFMILYVCITSALLRLYSSDGSLSSSSLSEYALFSIPFTSLVVRRCTLSIFSLPIIDQCLYYHNSQKFSRNYLVSGLDSFSDRYHLLSSNQYGFWRNMSTSLALMELTEEITTALDDKKSYCGCLY